MDELNIALDQYFFNKIVGFISNQEYPNKTNPERFTVNYLLQRAQGRAFKDGPNAVLEFFSNKANALSIEKKYLLDEEGSTFYNKLVEKIQRELSFYGVCCDALNKAKDQIKLRTNNIQRPSKDFDEQNFFASEEHVSFKQYFVVLLALAAIENNHENSAYLSQYKNIVATVKDQSLLIKTPQVIIQKTALSEYNNIINYLSSFRLSKPINNLYSFLNSQPNHFQLQNLKNEIQSIKSKQPQIIRNNINFQICLVTCPCCGQICMNRDPNHHDKHASSFHQPRGWLKTMIKITNSPQQQQYLSWLSCQEIENYHSIYDDVLLSWQQYKKKHHEWDLEFPVIDTKSRDEQKKIWFNYCDLFASKNNLKIFQGPTMTGFKHNIIFAVDVSTSMHQKEKQLIDLQYANLFDSIINKEYNLTAQNTFITQIFYKKKIQSKDKIKVNQFNRMLQWNGLQNQDNDGTFYIPVFQQMEQIIRREIQYSFITIFFYTDGFPFDPSDFLAYFKGTWNKLIQDYGISFRPIHTKFIAQDRYLRQNFNEIFGQIAGTRDYIEKTNFLKALVKSHYEIPRK